MREGFWPSLELFNVWEFVGESLQPALADGGYLLHFAKDITIRSILILTGNIDSAWLAMPFMA